MAGEMRAGSLCCALGRNQAREHETPLRHASARQGFVPRVNLQARVSQINAARMRRSTANHQDSGFCAVSVRLRQHDALLANDYFHYRFQKAKTDDIHPIIAAKYPHNQQSIWWNFRRRLQVGVTDCAGKLSVTYAPAAVLGAGSNPSDIFCAHYGLPIYRLKSALRYAAN